ncbi:hypothetical protein RFI_36093, partial [Reticulomyxa filosa]
MQKAFFHRFEKQWISYRKSLSPSLTKKVDAFQQHLCRIYCISNQDLPYLFYGFNEDTIPSAISCVLPLELFSSTDSKNEELTQTETDSLLQLFSPLLNPEKIVDLHMHKHFNGSNPIKPTFLTFKGVVNETQELCDNKMLLILTSDEMQKTFQRKWDCKRVEDYAKVSHFEQDIKRFFTESDSDKFILRYQYKHSEDLTQFFQIKWILEAAHTSYYKDNKNENDEKDSNTQNPKRKLVVLIVRNVHKLQYTFPIIFTKKWKIVFVDSLINQSLLSLQDMLRNNQLTMIDDPYSASILKKSLQRAFYYLKFPFGHNALSNIKHGFRDISILSEAIQNLMRRRLKQEVNKMTSGASICEILEKGLYKKLQLHKNGHQYSFIQNYENIVDSLITKGWIQVMLSLCEHCYLEAVAVNPKESLSTIFIESAKSEFFIPLSTHENTLDNNLHFFKVKMLYKAQFPFSWNFHIWFVAQIRLIYLWWGNGDKWAHKHIIGLKKYRDKTIIDDESNYNWGHGFKNNIQMIEVILYYMEDVIENYIQLLLLCNDQETWSSIKKLSTVKYSPLIQLVKATVHLSSYFFWNPSQMNDADNVSRKIHLACDALQNIACFLHERCSKEKEYQEFLSMYRQLQMKNLGLKHFWTINCYSTSSNEDLVAVNILMLAKRGFATDDILIQIIDSIIGSRSLSASLIRKITYFIRDLLHIIQRREHLDEQTAKSTFQDIIGHILQRVEGLPEDSSVNMLKLQALKLLLINVKGVDPTLIEKHGCKNASLNRAYEQMLMNQTILECKIVSNPNPIEKIEAISKLKMRLTKYIDSLCRLKTIEEFTIETFNATLESISDGLSYFKSKKTQFGDYLDVYEQYLHIWFLKQCCMLKGPCWTQTFFIQPNIRKRCPIFEPEKQQSCVFSRLKPRDKHEWLEMPFDKTFADKYNDFKNKLLLSKPIKDCVVEEKEDFVPLTGTACIVNLFNQDLSTRALTFYLSNAEDTVRPIVAKLSFHWLGTLQITKSFSKQQLIFHIFLIDLFIYFTLFETMTANPFTILLNNPDQYENQRMPGEPAKDENVKISTFSLHHCRNGHALLMKRRGTVRRVTKCSDPWCSAKIDEPELLTIQSDIDNSYVFFFYTVYSMNYCCYSLFFLKRHNPNVDFDLKSQIDVSPVICELLQLLNFLTLLLRAVSEPETLDKLPQYPKYSNAALWKLAQQKFMSLCKMAELNEEQLSMALHRWFCEFGRWYNQTGPETVQVVIPSVIHNFEKMLENEYISFFNTPEILESTFVYDSEISHIIHEKKEEKISPNESFIRNLFLVTRQMSSEELLFKLYNNLKLANKYPLLFNTLKIYNKLKCVKYLSSIGQWMKYCYMEYSGRLTHRECQNTTMNIIISNCRDMKAIQEWQKFKQCWNMFVDERVTVGSTEIKIPKLSNDDKEVNIQNNLLKSIGSYKRKSSSSNNENKQEEKGEQKYGNNSTSIIFSKSLFNISNQDIICIDKETIDDIIRSWYCPTLEYGQDYRKEWIDFESIENEIYDRAIFGRREINIS